MPLLSDAKTCYVGTQPITKIFAGTQFVWGSSQLRLVNFSVLGQSGLPVYLGAEFSERENCADCAAIQATCQSRFFQNGHWTLWQRFTGWITNGADRMGYLYIGNAGDTRWDNGMLELRTNGTVERINITLAGLPNIGSISPDLQCN